MTALSTSRAVTLITSKMCSACGRAKKYWSVPEAKRNIIVPFRISRKEVLAAVEEVTAADRELPSGIVLFQGLPKGDKMELIIQKAVELGATEIVPVEMKRCVVKLDRKKAEKKAERWQTIALGAAKQSKRMQIPTVHMPVTFQQALAMMQNQTFA